MAQLDRKLAQDGGRGVGAELRESRREVANQYLSYLWRNHAADRAGGSPEDRLRTMVQRPETRRLVGFIRSGERENSDVGRAVTWYFLASGLFDSVASPSQLLDTWRLLVTTSPSVSPEQYASAADLRSREAGLRAKGVDVYAQAVVEQLALSRDDSENFLKFSGLNASVVQRGRTRQVQASLMQSDHPAPLPPEGPPVLVSECSSPSGSSATRSGTQSGTHSVAGGGVGGGVGSGVGSAVQSEGIASNSGEESAPALKARRTIPSGAARLYAESSLLATPKVQRAQQMPWRGPAPAAAPAEEPLDDGFPIGRATSGSDKRKSDRTLQAQGAALSAVDLIKSTGRSLMKELGIEADQLSSITKGDVNLESGTLTLRSSRGEEEISLSTEARRTFRSYYQEMLGNASFTGTWLKRVLDDQIFFIPDGTRKGRDLTIEEGEEMFGAKS